MKRYPKYIASGVDWIGEVPEHWEVRKITRIYSKIGSGTTPKTSNEDYYSEDGHFWLQTGDLNDGVIVTTNKRITDFALKENSLKVFPRGSLVIAMYGATIGKIGLLEIECSTNQACCVLGGKSLLDKRYAFNSLIAIKEHLINLGYGGGQPNISQDLIRSNKLPVPPHSEQLQIASFLDRQTAEIDRVIATREKQIELLNELRISVISKAVTKGIDPNAKLKSSGVEWIGEIPEAWNLSKVKSLLRKCKYAIKTGPFGTQLKGDDLKEEGDVRVYNQRSVIDDDFTSTKYFVTNEKSQQLKPFFTQSEDILVTSRGTIGKTSILPSNVPSGILHPCLIALRLNNSVVINEWIKIYFNETDCFKTNIFLNSNSTTIEVIYSDTLKNVFIPIPSIKVQKTILEHIKNETSEIDSVIQKYNQQIELLKSYKTSLISEVVTGKIDIREHVNN